MKLQFDPNQPFQLQAVAAVTGLFDGQPQGAYPWFRRPAFWAGVVAVALVAINVVLW
jgi:hypothetical protein